MRKSSEASPELKELKKELKQKERELRNLVDAIASLGSAEWMLDKGNKLNDRITYLKGKISYLDNSAANPVLSEEQIYSYFKKDADIRSLDLIDQRSVIRSYVEKIIVREDDVEIHLVINKNNPGGGNNRQDCGYDGGDGLLRIVSTLHLNSYRRDN